MAVVSIVPHSTADLVSSWLQSLRPVRYGDVRAWINESWRLLDGWPQPSEWSGAEARLVLSLFRPKAGSVQEFIVEHDLDLGDEAGLDGSSSVWGSYARGRDSRSGGLVAARELFSVTMAVDDDRMASVRTWTAIALTEEFALFCERSDDSGLHLFPAVFGVIERRNLYRSAAVLLHHRDGKAGHRFEHAGNFFDDLHAWHIPQGEVYRLLLAFAGLGGRRVLTQDAGALKAFRPEGMLVSFDDVADLLRGALGERGTRWPTPSTCRRLPSRSCSG
jgi:hypothetical protein